MKYLYNVINDLAKFVTPAETNLTSDVTAETNWTSDVTTLTYSVKF